MHQFNWNRQQKIRQLNMSIRAQHALLIPLKRHLHRNQNLKVNSLMDQQRARGKIRILELARAHKV